MGHMVAVIHLQSESIHNICFFGEIVFEYEINVFQEPQFIHYFSLSNLGFLVFLVVLVCRMVPGDPGDHPFLPARPVLRKGK